MNKTIVFCQNIDHAERMRQALVNDPLNQDLVQEDIRYVMRITGDNPEGKGAARQLHRSQSVASR